MNPLAHFLSTYTQEAFRLETLPQYHVPGEWEAFQEYKVSGKLELTDDFKEYLKLQGEKVMKGARNIRARVIPASTEYFIFETKYGYIPQAAFGFELNFIGHQKYRKLIDKHFSKYHTFKDFWLFDRKDLVEMGYDETGHFLGAVQVVDKQKIHDALRLREFFIPESQGLSYVLDTYIHTREAEIKVDEALRELAKILVEIYLANEGGKK